MKRTLAGLLALCLLTASCQRAPESASRAVRRRPPSPPSLERTGQLRARLSRHFPGQYREDIELFWEPRDPPLRPDVLGELDPAEVFAYFREAGPVFPPAGVSTRCAVVGASGNLLGSGYGGEIDRHNIVIRINLAPTLGFEADVGRRTTHYLVTEGILRMVLAGKGDEGVDLESRLLSVAEDAYWLALYRPFDGSRAMEQLILQLGTLAR